MLSNMTVSYVMNITQVCRRELLCSILEMHSTVAVKATLENLNLDDLAERTEGFVARDLQVLVNRALHCHMADLPMSTYASSYF